MLPEKDSTMNIISNNNPSVFTNNNLKRNGSINTYSSTQKRPPSPPLEGDEFMPQWHIDAIMKIGNHADKCCKRVGQRKYEEDDNVVICWKCSTHNLVNKFWNMIECNACHALCKIPKKISKSKMVSNNVDDIDKVSLGRMVMPRHTAIVCPFCKFENKVDIRAKEMMCKACNSIWTIAKPDQNPPEEFCDSVNPESHYYKFKPEFKKDPQYPPKYSFPISDMFFPDPVLYHDGAPYPVNPFADYAMPYQEMLSFKRANKIMEHNSKIKKELKSRYKLPKGEEKKFYKITDDLIKKIDKSIKNNNYMAYVTNEEPKINNKNIKENDDLFDVDKTKLSLNRKSAYFLNSKNKERNQLIENMFLMK